MRAAGVPPAFAHLRARCTYPEERFSVWLDRIAAAADAAAAAAAASPLGETPLPPPPPPRGRRLGGGAGDASAPSVRTTSVAELGIAYAVRSGSGSSRPRRAAAAAAASPTPVVPQPSSKCNGNGNGNGNGNDGGDGDGGVEAAARSTTATVTGKKAGTASAPREAAEGREFFFAPGRAEVKALVRKLSRGLDVLDLCCGTGGFALNAAAGKARSALGVRGKSEGGGGAGGCCCDHLRELIVWLFGHDGRICFLLFRMFVSPLGGLLSITRPE